ncbi:NAD-dependent epimerase/dehydratase family protein [soil metagenome]
MSDSRPPILVLGATSLVGRFLPEIAAAQGRTLIAVSREPPASGLSGQTWVRADLTAPDLVLPPASAAVSVSPIWLLPEALPALERAGVRRIVAMSSTSRFTKIASPDEKERGVARSLADAEDALAAFCEPRGIGWTVLRPTLIYAEGRDQNISRLAGLIRRFRVLPISGEGSGLRQPVHAQDLAAAALAALDRPETVGRAYDLPGGETFSYRAMAGRVFEGLSLSPVIVSVPPPLWRLALALASPILPGATAAMGDRMSADLVFDAEPARRDLDWAPRAFHPKF